MDLVTSTAGVAQEIQLSIAPVFLLTGIAAVLTVLSSRLERIVDRVQALAAQQSEIEPEAAQISSNMSLFKKRIFLIQLAIRLCVSSALLICIVVVAIFSGDYIKWDLSPMIAALFVLSMGGMIAALVLFLLEVGLAARETEQKATDAIDELS